MAWMNVHVRTCQNTTRKDLQWETQGQKTTSAWLVVKQENPPKKGDFVQCPLLVNMLSKKAQYAFRALSTLVTRDLEQRNATTVDPPANPADAPTSITEMVKIHPMSTKFLETILLDLKRGGILGSKKGKGGGYYLLKHPEDTPLAQVIRILDGPIAPLPCVSLHFYERCHDCNEAVCGLNRLMAEVRDANLAVLEQRTLADLAGVRRLG